jgi:hypothetical protein
LFRYERRQVAGFVAIKESDGASNSSETAQANGVLKRAGRGHAPSDCIFCKAVTLDATAAFLEATSSRPLSSKYADFRSEMTSTCAALAAAIASLNGPSDLSIQTASTFFVKRQGAKLLLNDAALYAVGPSVLSFM